MSKNRRTTSVDCRVSRGLRACCYLCLGLLLFSPFPLFAHEVRPAYLELHQTGAETYDVLWKVPGQGENLRLGLDVEFPAGSTNVTPPRASMVNNAFVHLRISVRASFRVSNSS